MKPNFEHAEEDHEFHVEDEIYLIDKNKVDIFKGKINKINKKGYTVTLTDHDENGPKTVLSPKRLLLLTPTNNEIYEKQQEIRKKIIEEREEKKEMEMIQKQIEEAENNNEENQPDKKEETENGANEDDDQINTENKQDENKTEENTKTKSPKRIKKRKKAKKPIFDQHVIIKTAWHNGIHDVDQFKRYVKRNVKLLVSEFEKYHVMMNAAEEPPFSLGLNLSESDITKFWTTARSQWKKMFDDADSVDTDDFIRRTAATFRLQNQMESNARAALQFFFDTESSSANNETNFFQFSALLALFGPTQTMFRKIGHFLQCPSCLKDSFSYTDVADIKEPDKNTCLNEFVFFAGTNNETYVYNMPFTTTDEQYIIDEEGNKYDSWLKVFEHIVSEKAEEEAATVNSPTPIPIEA